MLKEQGRRVSLGLSGYGDVGGASSCPEVSIGILRNLLECRIEYEDRFAV